MCPAERDSKNGKKDLVWRAYCTLKQDCYFDTTDLFLRGRLSEFETSNHFNEEIELVKDVVGALERGARPESLTKIQDRLNTISFHCLPKVIDGDPGSKLFISNVRIQDLYKIDGVNYFVDAPVQLHLLDMLWCMIVGPTLDHDLGPHCLGNRLELIADESNNEKDGRLFKIFHHQYAKWRDGEVVQSLVEI